MAKTQITRPAAVATRAAPAVIALSLAPRPCVETIEMLERMLDEARAGQLIGFAFVAMRKRGGFVGDATGEAYRSPTFARGMVAALDDYLAELARNTR